MDLHQCNFLQSWQKLNFAALLVGSALPEFPWVDLKDQALTASPSAASENSQSNGLSCENSYSNAETSRNVFF